MSIQYNGFRATRPTVRTLRNNQYEVFFLLYSGSEKKQMRYKRGINNLKVKERRPQAEAIADVLWQALNTGWNPMVNKYPLFEDEAIRLRQMTFSQAMAHALKVKEKTLALGTMYEYRGYMRVVLEAATRCGYSSTPVHLIEQTDVKIIIATAKELSDWSSKARNQSLSITRALFSLLVDEGRLKLNPAKGIKSEKITERTPYKRLTPDQQKIIAESLSEKCPQYLEFLIFIHDTGIRPKELLLIKVYDVSMVSREILVRDDVAKNNKSRKIPITGDMLHALLRREIHNLPKDWYLFSKFKFNPGPKPYWLTAGARWWKKLIIDDLKIDCKLYGVKHTGADAKILAGINVRSLQSLYGHSSEQMTEKYIEVLQELHKKEIIDKSPSFAKVVQMKAKEG